MAIVRPISEKPVEKILAEFGVNADYVRELYDRWRSDPGLVDAEWSRYFEALAPGERPAPLP